MCPKMQPVGVTKKGKKKLLPIKLAICPDHPRRHGPPDILHAAACKISGGPCGRVRDVSYIFRFMKIG